jgi:predicted adenine nucleotide alpha hydrolase (AANH) superfamily ATPase
MQMKRTELPDFFKELSTLVEDAHRYAKVAGVNFFKQNFRRQGFLG